MHHAPLGKRLLSFFLDYAISIVLLSIVGFCYFKMNTGIHNYQLAPFVLISSLFMPLDTLYQLIINPRAYGIPCTYFGMLATLFIAEWLFLCLQEIFLSGQTTGKVATNLRAVQTDGSPIRLHNIAIRNLIKVVSRYCCFLPMISIFLTPNQQALHDLVGKTCVVSNKELL